MIVFDLNKKAAFERIEDEIALKVYNKVMKEFKEDPVTYTHEEMKKLIGLEE